MRSALSSKYAQNQLTIVSNNLDSVTGEQVVHGLKERGYLDHDANILIVHDPDEPVPSSLPEAMQRKIKFMDSSTMNVYDILRHDYLVLTEAALQLTEKRYTCY